MSYSKDISGKRQPVSILKSSSSNPELFSANVPSINNNHCSSKSQEQLQAFCSDEVHRPTTPSKSVHFSSNNSKSSVNPKLVPPTINMEGVHHQHKSDDGYDNSENDTENDTEDDNSFIENDPIIVDENPVAEEIGVKQIEVDLEDQNNHSSYSTLSGDEYSIKDCNIKSLMQANVINSQNEIAEKESITERTEKMSLDDPATPANVTDPTNSSFQHSISIAKSSVLTHPTLFSPVEKSETSPTNANNSISLHNHRIAKIKENHIVPMEVDTCTVKNVNTSEVNRKVSNTDSDETVLSSPPPSVEATLLPADDYDRGMQPETIATISMFLQDPAACQEIYKELDEYKSKEMQVHPESRQNTLFHLGRRSSYDTADNAAAASNDSKPDEYFNNATSSTASYQTTKHNESLYYSSDYYD